MGGVVIDDEVEVQPPGRLVINGSTRLLRHGPAVHEPILVLTKNGAIKPSNQVFFGSAYSPSEDWEKHQQYSPQIDFLSADYLQGVPKQDVPSWKAFFQRVGVRESGENPHVEEFAKAFVQDKLAQELGGFVPKDRQKHGYDIEAKRMTENSMVMLEVKGRKGEGPITLGGNEPEAAKQAKRNGDLFWVCIVPAIPESPELWVVEDAIAAGDFSTLTIPVSKWKLHGRRVV